MVNTTVNTMDELYRLQVTIAADPTSVYNALTSAEALENLVRRARRGRPAGAPL
jgi:uncharacterized protein YndB with AHSA1/START domain